MSTPAAEGEVPDLWSRLHLVERRIQRRDLVRALEQLNALAREAEPLADPVLTGFLQCLIGDAEYKQGNYGPAAAAYGAVRAGYGEHQEGRLLLRGGLGEVRSLLKQSEPGPAVQWATALVQQALRISAPVAPPADGTPVLVRSGLPPAPKVAARLAWYLRSEGYGPEAAALLALAPGTPGDESSRQEQAQILVRQGHHAAAEQLLVAWLEHAMSRQRTLPVKAWQLLMQTRRCQGKKLLSAEERTLIAGIPGHRRRCRIALASVLAARQAGQNNWTQWVTDWQLTVFPTPPRIRLSVLRLLLAEARKANLDMAAVQETATAIMGYGPVTVEDYIAAARAALFAAIKRGSAPDPQAMAAAAARKFGPSARLRTLHSLAKAAREAGQPGLAIRLYENVREETRPHARRRGQATHALAVLCFQQGNYSYAASLSGELADDPRLAPEFRLQALDRQCTALRQLNRDRELETARAKVDRLLPPDLSPSTLIRMARVARLSNDFGNDGLCGPLLERAVQAALTSVAQASHPGPALDMLLELNRKLYWDFSDSARVCKIWQELGAARRDWLWSGKSAFWEYVSLVLRSAGQLKRDGDVAALAAMAEKDAPPEALPFVATALADDHREKQRWTPSFAAYQSAVRAWPSHVECARAHYWLALKARREGRQNAATTSLEAVGRCFGSGVSLFWQWEYDARARLLLASGDVSLVARQSRYDTAFLNSQLASAAADESSLSTF